MRKMENCKANHILDRSSRLEVFCRKGVLKKFAKFTGKHQHQSLWFLAGFIKKDTPTKAFSCEFCEISKNIFSSKTPPVVLLFRVNRVSDHYARSICIKIVL